jgi:hypothetical protein
MKQTVTSREYKVVLKAARFGGPGDILWEAARSFWKSFSDSIAEIAIDIDGELNKPRKERTISFYDTSGRHLRSAHYICRERMEINSRDREVTLKFRHPDRYVSQDRNMAAARQEDGKIKFEEDIKIPFTTLYSFSTTQPISRDKTLNCLDDLVSLYPGIKKRLGPVRGDEAIGVVGKFVAREEVLRGAAFRIGRKPKTDAECALIVWYVDARPEDKPVIVEFSFRYGAKNENYERDAALRAYGAFAAMKESLADWLEAKTPTKTAFVYEQ